jgi:hypothetical protein
MGLRITEINQHPIAHVPGDIAAGVGDYFGDSAMIGGDDLAIILGIEARGERGRADQIAEHHRQLPALRLRPHPSLPPDPRRVGEGAVERGDSVEQPPTMPDRHHTDFPEILGRQARQYPRVYFVRAKRRLILLEPKTAEPCRNVHARLPRRSHRHADLPYRKLPRRAGENAGICTATRERNPLIWRRQT